MNRDRDSEYLQYGERCVKPLLGVNVAERRIMSGSA